MTHGRCVIFAWGPPFNWWPRLERGSRYFPGGLSLTWLWWGLYFVPRPVGALLAYSETYRLQEERSTGLPLLRSAESIPCRDSKGNAYLHIRRGGRWQDVAVLREGEYRTDGGSP